MPTRSSLDKDKIVSRVSNTRLDEYDFKPATVSGKAKRQAQLEEAYESMRRNVKEDVMQDIDRYYILL